MNLLNQINCVHFIIVGEGEYRKQFEDYAATLTWSDRIHFLGAVNHSQLLNYTAASDIGIALIENISLSYFYALPNKLFEYIMAGVPVLSSNLPQMKKIIDEYKVGKYVDVENDEEIISALKNMLSDQNLLNVYKNNSLIAANELNWESEFNKFKELLLN
jgi:glycosyltransferase involved in cell wall biosynthesis